MPYVRENRVHCIIKLPILLSTLYIFWILSEYPVVCYLQYNIQMTYLLNTYFNKIKCIFYCCTHPRLVMRYIEWYNYRRAQTCISGVPIILLGPLLTRHVHNTYFNKLLCTNKHYLHVLFDILIKQL